MPSNYKQQIEFTSMCFSVYEAPDGTTYEAFETTTGGIYCDINGDWDKEFKTVAEWDAFRAAEKLEWVGCDERDY